MIDAAYNPNEAIIEHDISTIVGEIIDDSWRALRPEKSVDIIEWITANIDLSVEIGTAMKTMLVPEPYQVDPWRELAERGERDVTFVAVEQIGKSELWKCYLLYRQATEPTTACIVYPSDPLAADTNRDSIEPRMKSIPVLARWLALPNSKRKDAYHFPDSTTYFMGAGTPLISRSFEVAIADEVDFWIGLTSDEEESKQSKRAAKNVDNMKNLIKRTRTFKDTRKIIAVCSPTLPSEPIWVRFMAGSQGYWHMRCLRCGRLTPSCDINALQFERDDEEQPIESSIRWCCPECKHEHVEADAWDLNAHGQFIHKHDHRSAKSYQVGALACPRAIKWLEVAAAICMGGKSGSVADQKLLDNSFRGMPLQRRRNRELETIETIRGRAGSLKLDMEDCLLLMSADTQDNGFYAVVRAVEKTRGRSIGICATFVDSVEGLLSLFNSTIGGRPISAGIIDEGGHRTLADVRPMVLATPNLFAYRGDSSVKEVSGFKMSRNVRKLILANPYAFQEELLWLLYQETDIEAAGYWALLADMAGYPDDYLKHLASMQPNSRKKAGHEYRNWEAVGREDHYFDAEKMLLVLCRYTSAVQKNNIWGETVPTYFRPAKKRRSISLAGMQREKRSARHGQ